MQLDGWNAEIRAAIRGHYSLMFAVIVIVTAGKCFNISSAVPDCTRGSP